MGIIGRTRLRPTFILSIGLAVTSCGGAADNASRSSGGATGLASTGTGGAFAKGGTTGSPIAPGTGARSSGGMASSGVGGLTTSSGANVSGSTATGGVAATGGGAATGTHSTAGAVLFGGATSAGGSTAGAAIGGKSAAGGRSFGGTPGGGTSSITVAGAGRWATGGGSGGGATTRGSATAGAGTAGATASDACLADPRLSNGTPHCNQNSSGDYGTYTWQLWSNQTTGCLTTYGGKGAAFSASWNNSGDFLARVGLSFDGSQTFQTLGTISAEFAENKAGDAGAYSYIGIYGWTTEPNVEFYVVEDSFDPPPIKVFSSSKIGTFEVDGGTYDVYASVMTGTGSTTSRIYSVRQVNRQCGQISVSDHFSKWAELGHRLGKMLEVSLVVESGGGVGSIDFSAASVTVN